MVDPVWEEKLSFLVQQDHAMREVLLQKGVLWDTYHPEMEKIHLANAKKLQSMIQKMGFPVLSNAGEKGVRLSWLIIHHAISWPDFMKEGLTQMRLAAAQHDYLLELLAYTDDRIAFYEDRPQLYGTNLDWIAGELKRTPIADPAFLDQRRKSLGLPPVSRVPIPTGEERPPKDPEKKLREFKEWQRRVGWIP
ncbi:DUF6624 domain-containing protein [Peredibacter starrii]|uniref:DUF6624 domain-containing protein n=1 Tax=Peredibacter starrii TaxID=28202 RepID=A0AAX4HRS4_9BACT|nr:DUF6624 domain-containing protein [Peredibacter starrii]WPU65936.1 DUF6624 domain-containing protein [Peredibacter starrii]